MMNRVQAKENAKTILRQRTLWDVLGFGALLATIFLLTAAVQLVAVVATAGGTALRILLAPGSIGSGLSWLAGVPLMLVFSCASALLGLLFQAGLVRSALRLVRGDTQVRVVDAALAGDRLGAYIRVALWQLLFLSLWGLSGAVPMVLGVLLLQTGGLGLILGGLLMIAGLGWSAFISANKACQYFFSYFVAEDEREMRALDCLRESGRLVDGHKWELFVTILSFLGWDLLRATLLANIFIIPYQFVTYAGIYEQLTGAFRPTARDDMPWRSNGRGKAPAASGAKAAGSVRVISGEFAGTVFPLAAGDELRIGRDPQRANVVVSPDSHWISGLHCVIRFEAATGSFFITDHSSNGTYVDQRRIPAGTAVRAGSGADVRLADGAMVLRLI